MIDRFTPTDLESLGRAFALLDGGKNVLLTAAGQCVPESEMVAASSPRLGLYSSGSTGIPKLHWWPWARLVAEARIDARFAGWTWASPFSPLSFAGIQVAIQARVNGGRPLSLGPNFSDMWDLLAERNVEALSCTPTYLDLLLRGRGGIARPWTPRQITLGGEPLRASCGERLRRTFPTTRFAAIYASAEFGVLLKSNRLDGWYEVASLAQRHDRWRIENGGLEIWHSNSWRATGDLVERDGDWMRVIGRADAVANVAGSKVSLAEITSLAEEVPGVRAAVAFAEANPVSGEIVCLRFTPEEGYTSQQVREHLETHLRATLKKEAWPRRWEAGEARLGANSKRATP
jgi:long-chain acyl-CoA synthetase